MLILIVTLFFILFMCLYHFSFLLCSPPSSSSCSPSSSSSSYFCLLSSPSPSPSSSSTTAAVAADAAAPALLCFAMPLKESFRVGPVTLGKQPTWPVQVGCSEPARHLEPSSVSDGRVHGGYPSLGQVVGLRHVLGALAQFCLPVAAAWSRAKPSQRACGWIF